MTQAEHRGVWDVAIVGAGAAGIAAAAELSRAGMSVLVLEARDRIGGRIHTIEASGLAVPVELGAEFIHGESPDTFRALQSTGIAAVDTAEDHWTLRDGRLESAEDLFDDMHRLMRIAESLPCDESVAQFLERTAGDRSLERARMFTRRIVEGFDAADPEKASIQAIAQEWRDGGVGGAPQFRPSTGYGRILERLASGLTNGSVRLRLQSVVEHVEWQAGSVTLKGSWPAGMFQIKARRAIITLPISILQLAPEAPGAVRFSPPLAEKQEALNGLALGAVIKMVMRFRTAFWEHADHGRYRNAAFFHAPDAAVPTFWTPLPWRVPVLTAWAGGPRADRLSGADRSTIIDFALDSLRRMFESEHDLHDELDAVYLHDWQRDPFSRGAYSYVTVGGCDAREKLAQPLLDTLFFAGEAVDDSGDASTVGGALRSGRRAAQRLLESAHQV